LPGSDSLLAALDHTALATIFAVGRLLA
jgi:hypothetical protein